VEEGARMSAYYNEIDPYAAQWLRNLIAENLIAPGEVDERSIVDVMPGDLRGFKQCHFFAGIGGWSYALRLAGWPDDRPVWTGSCPCQPFSVAGAGKGQDDARHLWPEFFRLIAGCRPAVVMGEQVAAAVGKSWLDGVCLDLEGIGYATGAAVVPACAVGAPHRRDRLWFVADSSSERRQQVARGTYGYEGAHEGRASSLHNLSASDGESDVADRTNGHDGRSAPEPAERQASEFGVGGVKGTLAGFWDDAVLIRGADGKARRVEPGIRLLAHGIPARVGKLRALGNAIVPQVAAEVIGAYMDAAA
jgi:DNA (cytosine-5)-methyltransferase 1